MATLSVRRKRGWRATTSVDGGNEYDVSYDVVASAPITPGQALSAAGLPLRGAYFALTEGGVTYFDMSSLCVKKDIEQSADGLLYRVKCSFRPPKGNEQQQNNSGNPWDAAPKFSYSFVRYDEPAAADVTGKKYANAVGERLEHFVTRTNLLITVEINYLNLDPNSFGAYVDRVNASTWRGYPAKSVKFNSPGRVEPMRHETSEGTLDYWHCALEFEHNGRLWIPTKKANIGTFYKKTVGEATTYVLPSDDATGVPTGNEVYLNADGEKVDPEDSEPLEFTDYEAIDFSYFGI